MFSYAGIALSEPADTEIGDWIAANIRPETLFPLAYQSWPGQWYNGPILNFTPDIQRPVSINSLHWPHGAARFATGFFVVSESQLNAIRKVVYKYGAEQAAPFIFTDGDNSITTNLWMLPATPLQQAAPGAEMHLLTLVDDRYWWWGESVDLAVNAGTTTWADLYDGIGTVLGLTLDVDPVQSAYDKPVAQYQVGARPLPLYFDAIAFSVGQRVVRYLDGSVSVQNAGTSAATITANLAAGWNKYAGGEYDFDARSV